MPFAAKSYCLEPGCPHMGSYKGRCPAHARQKEQQRYNVDARKWYQTSDWQILRIEVLAKEPICMVCHKAASTAVDHVEPHRGDYVRFWDRGNLQGICSTCHGAKTARGE